MKGGADMCNMNCPVPDKGDDWEYEMWWDSVNGMDDDEEKESEE